MRENKKAKKQLTKELSEMLQEMALPDEINNTVENKNENFINIRGLQSTDTRLMLITFVCGLVTACIGGLILAGWALGDFYFLRFSKNFIPMADETALLFLILGVALAVAGKSRNNVKLRYYVIGSAIFIAIIAFLILIDFATGNFLNVTDWLKSSHEKLGNIPIGKMSFITAFCFILASISLILSSGKTANISACFGSLILFIGFIIVNGYCYGAPVLYGGTMVPVALPTAIIFIISAIGILASAGKDAFPLKYFLGVSTRTRLLRNLLPVIFTLLLISGWAEVIISGNSNSTLVFIYSIIDILTLIIVGFIIWLLSRSIGDSIDRNNTERKKAEEKIIKLNRVYAVLSNINQAIIRIKDKALLFNEVCRIAVEDGKFLMSWIGLVNTCTNKVEVSASAGATDDYLDKINIDLYDPIRSNGPTGRTIKTGIHNISNNIENDDSMAPWKDDAIRLGYRSSASFPIKVFGKVQGVFNIYSSEVGFFDDVEIKLLDELANNISYAIEFMQNESERKRNEDISKARLSILDLSGKCTLEQLLQKTLDEIEILTGSKIGFYHFIEADQKTINLKAWSTNTIENMCRTKVEERIYKIDEAGVWIECFHTRSAVIHNDFDSLTHRKGLPDGHAPVIRELLMPVIRNEKIVAILGVGNKEKDYDEDDIRTVSQIADLAWDITERKLAEDDLKQSEKKYREVVENTTDIIFTINENGKFTYSNPAGLRISGYTNDELLQKSYKDISLSEYNTSLLLAYYRQMVNKKPNTYFEFPFRKKDGEICWFGQNASLIIEKDKIKGLHIIARDITVRKLAEFALKESEEKYRLLTEHLPDGILIHSDGIIVYANKSAKMIFGADVKTEIIGMPVLNFVHPDYLPTVKDRIKKVVNTGKDVPVIEEKLFKLDRTVFDAEVSAIPFNYLGKPSIQVVVRDITKRKKSEQALIKSEKRYKYIIDNSLAGIYQITLDGNIIYGNDYMLKMMEFEGKDYTSLNVIRFYKNSKERDRLLNEIKEYGEVKNFEIELMTFKGNTITVLINSKLEDNILTGIIHDITEKKKFERELIKLNKAVETSGEVIFMTNTDGIFSYINPEFTNLYGWRADEVIGLKTPSILKSGLINLELYKTLWETLFKKEVFRREFINQTKNGKLIYMDSSINPVLDENGNIYGFLAIQKDITEKKKAEQELIMAKEKAEEMNRLKSSFLANMSHELRTPMNGIIGFSQILQFEDEMDSIKEISNLIYRSSKRLMSTLNSILDLSRIGSGNMKPNYTLADLVELAHEAVNVFKADADNKHLCLNVESKEEIILANTDQRIVIEILINLINNALKFTKEGGVTIRVHLEKSNNKHFIVYDVIDTGIGIDKKDFDTIFEEFRQASEGLSRGFEGTGLGLTICKRYCELLEGTITVQSKIGEGSTFTVKLPVTVEPGGGYLEENEEPKWETFRAVQPEGDKPLVLYVEDDEVSILLVEKLLKGTHDIDIAINSAMSVQMAMKKQYTLILMDINLGKGANGIDATREIRKMENYRDVPIIALTAYAMVGDRDIFIAEGCSDYLSKPFEGKELLDLLKKYL